jgi:hemolysin activation/secretion protein
MRYKILSSVFLFGFNLSGGAITSGQIAAINPSSIEPGVVGATINDNFNLTRLQPAEGTAQQPNLNADTNSQLSEEAKKISFQLNNVRFTGNTVYSQQELSTIFTTSLHKKITVAKLMELVQEVTHKYQKEGYFLSRALIPPQEIANGVVTIQIVEGFISQVDIQGVEGNKKEFLQKYAVAIEAIKPIRLDKLERYLLLINDIGGFQVKSLIEPDPAVKLGSKLTLVTQYTPYSLTVTQDNYQTRYLGPGETSGFGYLNSLIIPGGSLYGRVLTGNPASKLQYYEGKYLIPLGTEGITVGVDGYYTQTNPQFILSPLDIHGFSGDGNVFATYPLIRSRAKNLRILGQFDYMNNHSNALDLPLYYDRIRDLTLGIQYDDVLWKGQDSVYLGLDKGFNILGADNQGFRSRFAGKSDFLKVNATASRTQYLNDRFSLFALVTGQYSGDVLLASEVFTFGGPFLGRGYDLAQFTSDKAVAGTVELRMDTNPNLPFYKQAQYYIFYDAGKFWNSSYLISLEGQASGASTGMGLRASLFDHFHLEGFLGRPLTTPNATQIILDKNGNAFLAFGQLSFSI